MHRMPDGTIAVRMLLQVSRRAQHGAAAAAYLIGALWALRAVLPGFASTFAMPTAVPHQWERVVQSDQKLTASNVAWNAHRFITRPSALYEPGQCYPATNAATLGPHQLAEGLIGVLPYALTRDPIVTYNVVAVATLWIPALAMYTLVLALTGSMSGAF